MEGGGGFYNYNYKVDIITSHQNVTESKVNPLFSKSFVNNCSVVNVK